ncbi:MAG: translation initiation factor 1 [Paraglaciecola sp.]|jgi:translation initiation factor 1
MSQDRVVFSTASGRVKHQPATPEKVNSDGIVRIRRESKGRKGKGVTTISGLELSDAELKNLCTSLKKMCGTGGAVKDGIIEIQGDNREKIKVVLEELGHVVKFAGG